MNYVVFWDVESTGKDPLKDHIISIGAVLAAVNRSGAYDTIGEFHTLVSTDRAIDQAAFRVHGISAADLKDAPTFADASTLLTTFVTERVPKKRNSLTFVAHNGMRFDDIILARNCANHGIDLAMLLKNMRVTGFADSLRILRAALKDRPREQLPKTCTGRVSFALGNCYSKFCPHLPPFKAHDALEDTRALYAIFNTLNVSLPLVLSMVARVSKYVITLRQKAKLASMIRPNYNSPSLASQRDTPLTQISRDYHFCVQCITFVRIESLPHKCSVQG